MTKTYDFIIVGAGSAGCVLAERLSRDRTCEVLLLEAGGDNEGVFIDMPAALSIPMNLRRYNWGFSSEPEPGMDGRSLHCPRGRGLGGSSAINGMVYVRGHARDFDRWSAMGAEGWSAAEVWSCYELLEETLQPRVGDQLNPLYRRFLDAGREAGHRLQASLNEGDQEGVGPLHMTVLDGRRHSARRAFLNEALQRHNLTVERQATVSHVRFSGRQAVGVSWGHAAAQGREIVLCAGPIGSPAILERSGVGDARHLRAAGVEVVHHLPGVGENLMDHLEVYVQQRCARPVSLHTWLNPLGKLRIGARWLLTRGGLGATNHFETGAFIRSDARAAWPDVQFHFLPAAMHYDGSRVAASHGFQIHTGPMLPESRGSVHIRSREVADAPEIRFNYLSSERDVEVFRLAVRHARDFFAQPAFRGFADGEIAPGEAVVSDQDLDAWIRENAESAYHPCGTCRMGVDETAVVDPQGRVRGVEGLRVVDSSIFPFITNGNLNAPTLMCAVKIGEEMAARG